MMERENALRALIYKWRTAAVTTDGKTTCVNHAFYRCADELESLLGGRTESRNEQQSTLLGCVNDLEAMALWTAGLSAQRRQGVQSKAQTLRDAFGAEPRTEPADKPVLCYVCGKLVDHIENGDHK